MKVLIPYLLMMWTSCALAQGQSAQTIDANTKTKPKEEVLENPTLKTLSGSLSPFSFFSAFSYRGGSLHDPFSAEQPNITAASEKPNLQSLSGRLGMKYRLSKFDNLSMQVGAYMATPFHSNHVSSDPRVQKEFDNNHQKLNVDDPNISYFRTYYLGKIQNVTFATGELTTRGVLTDFGYFGSFSLSHASAFPVASSLYVAAMLSATQIFFDQDASLDPKLGMVSLKPYQTERLYKASLSLEYYPFQKIALRAITDIGSYFQMRDKKFSEVERRELQQTVAMTYFFNRDISIAPSINFIVDDLRSERTNLGMSFNVNL